MIAEKILTELQIELVGDKINVTLLGKSGVGEPVYDLTVIRGDFKHHTIESAGAITKICLTIEDTDINWGETLEEEDEAE